MPRCIVHDRRTWTGKQATELMPCERRQKRRVYLLLVINRDVVHDDIFLLGEDTRLNTRFMSASRGHVHCTAWRSFVVFEQRSFFNVLSVFERIPRRHRQRYNSRVQTNVAEFGSIFLTQLLKETVNGLLALHLSGTTHLTFFRRLDRQSQLSLLSTIRPTWLPRALWAFILQSRYAVFHYLITSPLRHTSRFTIGYVRISVR